jgi:hypothetical protein
MGNWAFIYFLLTSVVISCLVSARRCGGLAEAVLAAAIGQRRPGYVLPMRYAAYWLEIRAQGRCATSVWVEATDHRP